ncbi:MAG: XRE family transcriptional regulator [Bacteroidales bacterium]|nr:XRE family transcriptional regulator [Bacteroidales bacterium]
MNDKIHIGKSIKNKMVEDGRKVSWLAEKLHCDPSNIHKIFKKTDINTTQLLKISLILDFDFFNEYSEFIGNSKKI